MLLFSNVGKVLHSTEIIWTSVPLKYGNEFMMHACDNK